MNPPPVTSARLVVVTTPELAWGFRLAGVHALPATSPAETGSIIERLAGEAALGVVAVHAPLYDAVGEAARRRLEDAVPVVVRLPSGLAAESGESGRDRLAALLRRAVGYHITFPGTAP